MTIFVEEKGAFPIVNYSESLTFLVVFHRRFSELAFVLREFVYIHLYYLVNSILVICMG